MVINNNPKAAHVRRITKKENCGRNAKRGIEIEKYPDIRKPSAVENKTFRHAINGKPLNVAKMKKTNTRLNKYDRKKLGIK